VRQPHPDRRRHLLESCADLGRIGRRHVIALGLIGLRQSIRACRGIAMLKAVIRQLLQEQRVRRISGAGADYGDAVDLRAQCGIGADHLSLVIGGVDGSRVESFQVIRPSVAPARSCRGVRVLETWPQSQIYSIDSCPRDERVEYFVDKVSTG